MFVYVCTCVCWFVLLFQYSKILLPDTKGGTHVKIRLHFSVYIMQAQFLLTMYIHLSQEIQPSAVEFSNSTHVLITMDSSPTDFIKTGLTIWIQWKWITRGSLYFSPFNCNIHGLKLMALLPNVCATVLFVFLLLRAWPTQN